MKPIIVIPARMTSSRFPGKVLADLGGHPVLKRLIRRLSVVAPVVVATTASDDDWPIVELAVSEGVQVVRGSEDDLIERHLQAMYEAGADVACLAGADDPLLDPGLFALAIVRMSVGDVDYVRTAGWPLGLNVWAWTKGALELANEYAVAADEREHDVDRGLVGANQHASAPQIAQILDGGFRFL